MASKLNKAIQSALNEFQKYHNQWEWSDLISWLQGVNKILNKYSEFVFNDNNLYNLAKRLLQCLNPSLPQGLHSKTLQIYKKLLSGCEMTAFPTFSSGLLPLFPNFATQNKVVFFEIIQTIYIPKIEKISCILPGVIRSLLSGADDRAQTFHKVKQIIQKFSETHLSLVQSSVWQFVIASDSYRIIGLKYMQANFEFEYHQQLAIKGLLKSLQDQQVLVKRQALDVIKTYYKLLDPQIGVWMKISLMEGALRLLRFRDLTLMRRLWDWAFPYDLDQNEMKKILEIIAPALEFIFYKHELEMKTSANPDTIKIASVRIVDLMVENESNGIEIIQSIGIIYLKHIVNADLSIINGKNDGRASLVFLEQRGPILWQELNKHLLFNIHVNQEQCVKMLQYAVKNIQFDTDSIMLVLNTLLLSLQKRNMPEQMIYLAISISEQILNSKEQFQQFPIQGSEHIESLFLNLHWLDMLPLSKLLGTLQKLGYTSKRAQNKIRTCQVDFLNMIQLLCNIRSKQISLMEIHILWQQYHTKNKSKVINLLLQIQPLVPDVWTQSLAYILIDQDPLKKEAAIRTFSQFWGSTSHLPQLGKCLEDGHAIFIMIDHLNNQNTLVSHSARQWLLSACTKISYLLDPLYSILLHRFTNREKVGKQYIYLHQYDTRRVLQVLRKIKILIQSSGEIPEKMDETILSQSSRDLILYHNLTLGSYLEILVDVLVMFINSNSKIQKVDNKAVQAFACEVLQELVKYLPSPLAFKALRGSVACLYRSIQSENGVMQLLLLKVIENILQYCQIQNQVEMCSKIFQSTMFSFSLEKGMHTQDAYLRSHWVQFITEIIPYLIQFLSHPILTNYLRSLLNSYSVLIIDTEDPALIQGLKDLMHLTLGISSKFKKEAFEPMIHQSVKTMVFKELRTVFSVCVCLYNRHDPQIRRKAKNMEIDIIDEIAKLFTPISNNYQQEFLFSLINVWGVYCQEYSNSEENLVNLLRLIPCMNISLEGFIDGVSLYLDSGESGGQELCAAHFLYSLLQRHTMSIIRFRNLEKIWQKIISISKNLIKSVFQESVVMVISLFFVLSNQVFGFQCLKDKKIIKQIKETIEIALSKGCEYSLNCFKIAQAIPYPGIHYRTDMHVYQVILLTMIDKQAHILDFYFKDTQKPIQIVHQKSCMFIIQLPKTTYGTILISKLVLKFVLHYKQKLLKKIKKQILEFLTGSNFYKVIKNEKGSLGVWLQIMNCFSTIYAKKHQLLQQILNKYQSNFFTRSSQALFLHKNSLLMMSLTLLSGKQDEYINSINTIIQYIKKSLQQNELFPYLAILVRTLMVRFNYGVFLGVWSNIWPELQFLLIENSQQSTDFLKAMAALKFIDMMLTLGIEQIYRIIWMFCFDVNEIDLYEGQCKEFIPIYARNFLSGYSAQPVKINRRQEDLKKVVKKKPLLLGEDAQCFDDLDRHVKTIIQHCMYYNSTMGVTDFKAINESIEFDMEVLASSLDN